MRSLVSACQRLGSCRIGRFPFQSYLEPARTTSVCPHAPRARQRDTQLKYLQCARRHREVTKKRGLHDAAEPSIVVVCNCHATCAGRPTSTSQLPAVTCVANAACRQHGTAIEVGKPVPSGGSRETPTPPVLAELMHLLAQLMHLLAELAHLNSLPKKRKAAAWNPDYLAQVLNLQKI